ncbi:hypothetical protein Aau02nite_29300 [Amorphoplanes auranticolor]|uniref:Diguanylate cyclase (GGDEF)-like protein n=1 Tax=Actinoplanes auranticolor TaxID=47988 RepID=A0A919S8S4_9ACTN|nr:hypothetical protein Aau02nite_29300 [Actinoplanes auranticolor]
MRDRNGKLRLIFVHCMDVTRQQEHEAALRRQVRQDSLTGLLSRAAFEVDLLALLTADAGPASVLYLDVDRFKTINDGSGHSAGDDVLCALADRVSRTVPAGSLVARLGGDEFVVGTARPGGDRPAGGPGRAGRNGRAAPGGRRPAADRGEHRPGRRAGATPGRAGRAVRRHRDVRGQARRRQPHRAVQRRHAGGGAAAHHRRVPAAAGPGRPARGDPAGLVPAHRVPGTGRIVGAEALVRMWTTEGELLAPGHFIAAAEETAWSSRSASTYWPRPCATCTAGATSWATCRST